MNIIQSILADLRKLEQWIETEVSAHPMQSDALTAVKQATTALESHPDAVAAPVAADASSAAAAPANDGSETVAATPATPAAT